MTWKKGQSGNPNGRTKDKVWGDAIRLAVNEAFEDGDRKKLRALADKLVEKALGGDITAMKEVGDRLDGKAAQSVDVTYRKRTVTELTDDELIDIASGGGDGDSDAQDSEEELSTVH